MEQLDIRALPPSPSGQSNMDDTQWLGLFYPFSRVKMLRVTGTPSLKVSSTLQQVATVTTIHHFESLVPFYLPELRSTPLSLRNRPAP